MNRKQTRTKAKSPAVTAISAPAARPEDDWVRIWSDRFKALKPSSNFAAAQLAIAHEMLEHRQGTLAPFEHFFQEICQHAVVLALHGECPTPKELQEAVTEYAEDVAIMTEFSAKFQRNFAKQLAPKVEQPAA